ncbi:hypothetical protein JKP88DRAFT_265582 [Tribonema minus]|uniref:Uncharacterized protein n=1 Tax=Tribonema minus TaxID=303371 RepID=A0A835YJY7_9STRA|nr:hypothetical protein JKP88DRAFT_265582 [Tribonema minus]
MGIPDALILGVCMVGASYMISNSLSTTPLLQHRFIIHLPNVRAKLPLGGTLQVQFDGPVRVGASEGAIAEAAAGAASAGILDVDTVPSTPETGALSTVRKRRRIPLKEEQGGAATLIQSRVRTRLAQKRVAALADGGTTLDRAAVKRGLHTLGRAPHSLRHCLTGCDLRGLGLRDVAALSDWPLLQTLDVSDNALTELAPLCALPFLCELHAARNGVTEVLDFEVLRGRDQTIALNAYPHVLCAANGTHARSADMPWEDLLDWRSSAVRAESALALADLSENAIAAMRDLSPHRNLHTLLLAHNAIAEIRGLSALRCLTRLDLSHNRLTQTTGLEGLPLVELDLSHNAIAAVRGLAAPESGNGCAPPLLLRRLNLADNFIIELSGLQRCASLVTLDLSGNALSALRQVEWLRDCAVLRELSLARTAAAEQEWYRLRVLLRLQGLTLLDSEPVSPQEKVEALNLAGGEGSDLANRQALFRGTFQEHEAQWCDLLPPYQEPEPAPMGLEGNCAVLRHQRTASSISSC